MLVVPIGKSRAIGNVSAFVVTMVSRGCEIVRVYDDEESEVDLNVIVPAVGLRDPKGPIMGRICMLGGVVEMVNGSIVARHDALVCRVWVIVQTPWMAELK